MFSLGISETFIILLAFIIFVKPDDYPFVFRKIGQFFRKCDQIWKNITNEIDIFDDHLPPTKK